MEWYISVKTKFHINFINLVSIQRESPAMKRTQAKERKGDLLSKHGARGVRKAAGVET